MSRFVALRASVVAFAAMLLAAQAQAQNGAGGWNGGKLHVPASLAAAGRACESAPGRRCAGEIKPGRHPVVLYLHGCGGPDTYKAFLDLGAVVVSPNSFAGRQGCDFDNPKAMEALRIARLADIGYALSQLKAAPWADPARLVLAGYSHGGMMAATYTGDEFKARVILAWTCGAPGFPNLEGIAGKGPVLAVLGTDDEFFRARHAAGRCGEFLKRRGAPSQNVVVPGGTHDIVDHAATRKALAAFMTAVLR
jgi:dienelactone hydrolase